MNNREQLASAVKRVAWAYVLNYLNFNLGTVNLLPEWGCYALILSVLPVLAQEEESTGLLKPFGIILTAWYGFRWILDIFNVAFDGGVFSTIIMVVGLYFHFQLLTNLASISEKYGCPETNKLLTLRLAMTVITTAMNLPLGWQNSQLAMGAMVVIALVTVLWTMTVLFALHRSLAQLPQEQTEETE